MSKVLGGDTGRRGHRPEGTQETAGTTQRHPQHTSGRRSALPVWPIRSSALCSEGVGKTVSCPPGETEAAAKAGLDQHRPSPLHGPWLWKTHISPPHLSVSWEGGRAGG